VIAEQEKRGFACSVRRDPGVFDGQLPVISAQSSAPSFIDDRWDQVEEVVKAASGEYDGWEASTGRPQP
jgi:hypothetical protein